MRVDEWAAPQFPLCRLDDDVDEEGERAPTKGSSCRVGPRSAMLMRLQPKMGGKKIEDIPSEGTANPLGTSCRLTSREE